jgi:hypothetical protein
MKHVYLWEFNEKLIFPTWQGKYERINEEAEELLKTGWNPSYIFGNKKDYHFFFKIFSFKNLDSFDFLNNTSFLCIPNEGMSGDALLSYYEIIDKYIYEKLADAEFLHILVKEKILI